MANLPGPYEIEFTLTGFTAPVREHKIRMNVAALGSPVAGSLPSAVTIQKAGGGSAALDVVANQAWGFIRLQYAAFILCSGYTLWKYVSGTYGKDFISNGAVATPAGGGAALTIAHQVTLTFRSANGGIMKTVFLETGNTGNTQVALTPNPAGTPNQRWASYVLSADNVALAADDAYPVAALRDSRGENERVFRKVYRGT